MQSKLSIVTSWLYRAGTWLFPSLTELQVVLAYSIGFGLLLIHPSSVLFLWNLMASSAHKDIAVTLLYLLYLLIIIAPLFVVVRKDRLSDGTKTFVELIYFLFLALLALTAWDNPQLTGGTTGSFAWVGLWTVRVAFGLSILRLILVLLATKLEDADLQRFVSQNFKDAQFRLIAFGTTFVIGMSGVLVLQRFYSNLAVIALLSLAYGGVIVSLLSKLRLATVR